VPTTLEPWQSSKTRRASVNSFGYGGANVHAILESAEDFLRARGIDPIGITRKSAHAVKAIQDALRIGLTNGSAITNGNGYTNGKNHINGNGHITPPLSDAEPIAQVFALSAFDPGAGEAWAQKLSSYVEQRLDIADSAFLDSLAFTLSERRTLHPWKAAVTASSSEELVSRLKKLQFVNVPPRRNLAFVFTGQGAQWCGMGKELIDACPLFRESLRKCSAALQRMGASFDVIGMFAWWFGCVRMLTFTLPPRRT
jgi:acyl transferase domain-containing protein